MRLLVAAFAIVALPGLAWSQVGATICKPSFDGRSQVCEPSIEEKNHQAMMKGQADLQAFMADTPSRRSAPPAPASDRQHTLVAMEVGALIAEGKCAEALGAAVDGEALDVAQIVREVCSR